MSNADESETSQSPTRRVPITVRLHKHGSFHLRMVRNSDDSRLGIIALDLYSSIHLRVSTILSILSLESNNEIGLPAFLHERLSSIWWLPAAIHDVTERELSGYLRTRTYLFLALSSLSIQSSRVIRLIRSFIWITSRVSLALRLRKLQF